MLTKDKIKEDFEKTEEELLIKLLEEYRDKEGDYFPEVLWSLQPRLILFLEQSNRRFVEKLIEEVIEKTKVKEGHSDSCEYKRTGCDCGNENRCAHNACLDLLKEHIEMGKLLKIARCPDDSCDGKGTCQVGEDDISQCQWCDERNKLLSNRYNTSIL